MRPFVVQLVVYLLYGLSTRVQQVHNKSQQVEFGSLYVLGQSVNGNAAYPTLAPFGRRSPENA